MEPRNRAERRQPDRLAYSPAEAAEKIGISRAKPSLKLDRRRLIRHEALVGLLDGLEGGGRVA
jgi:hypothetical protein